MNYSMMARHALAHAANYTAWFIVVVIVLIVVYDVTVGLTGWAPTISSVVRGWGNARPWLKYVVAAGMFVLWLHLFSGLWAS
jgi:hypothetical protein